MRAQRFDAVILTPNSLRTAALAWLGGARRRIGYARDFRTPLLTDPIPMPRSGMEQPLVFRFMRMAEQLDCDPTDTRLELATTATDECRADQVWRNLSLGHPDQVVTMNCGSANSPSRRWPLDRFATLARRIADEKGMSVLVLCGPGEQDIAREVTRLAEHPRVVDMSDQPLDLGTAKACIRRSAMMVTTDSGPKHIAVAFGRPVVTLHGPVSPLETFNPTARTIPVSLDLSCLDCRKQICPLGHNACMQDMTVDYVYRHIQQAQRQFRVAA
jgi:heptosyltransferase-2